MSITFDSKFVYITGISGAYTHEEAKEILAQLSEIINAAQQNMHTDAACHWCEMAADPNNRSVTVCPFHPAAPVM